MHDSQPHGTVYIEGIALWAPRLPGWETARAVLCGEAGAPQIAPTRPAPALLAPTERRRAPDTVAIALEVAARACENARRDPKTLPSVFASTHGDLAVSDYLCGTLAKAPRLTSPTKFHNSVHNAAAGYWTIGTGCRAPYTAISAHQHTFGAGCLESVVQCATEESPILYVVYDIDARGPLSTMARSRGLFGAALVLAPCRNEQSSACMEWSVREQAGASSTPARAENAALVEGNAMAGCLPLFEALADRKAREVIYTLSSQLVLELHVSPVN